MADNGGGNDHHGLAAALVGFRKAFFGCLTGWADTLFELADAVLCAPGRVGSVPALSLDHGPPRSTSPGYAPRFALSEPDTWPHPYAELTAHDARYGNIRVQAWHRVHPKLHGRGRWKGHDEPPIVPGTVMRVGVEHLPKATARAK